MFVYAYVYVYVYVHVSAHEYADVYAYLRVDMYIRISYVYAHDAYMYEFTCGRMPIHLSSCGPEDDRLQVDCQRPAPREGAEAAMPKCGDSGLHKTGPTQGLQCSSFLGSILSSLSQKQAITKKDLHWSLWVDRWTLEVCCLQSWEQANG